MVLVSNEVAGLGGRGFCERCGSRGADRVLIDPELQIIGLFCAACNRKELSAAEISLEVERFPVSGTRQEIGCGVCLLLSAAFVVGFIVGFFCFGG